MEALKVMRPTGFFAVSRGIRDFASWLKLTCKYAEFVLMILGAWFVMQWLGFVPFVLTEDQVLQAYNRYNTEHVLPVQQRAAKLEKQTTHKHK